jgi:hypothetical protein
MTIFVIPVFFWRKTYSAGSGTGAGRERLSRDAAKMEGMVDKSVAKNGRQETRSTRKHHRQASVAASVGAVSGKHTGPRCSLTIRNHEFYPQRPSAMVL